MTKCTLVYGKDRRVLARYMRESLAQVNRENPLQRAFLIVPEQLKASTERLYFHEAEERTLLLSEVVSFRRFAMRMMELAGGESRQGISQGMQAFLLGQVLKELKPELSAYGEAIHKSSFLSFLGETIGDFLRYDIASSDLAEAAQEAESRQELRYAQKFTDLSRILGAYQKRLEDLNLSPGDLLLNQLADLLEELLFVLQETGGEWSNLPNPWSNYDFLADAKVFIHGFGISRNFTPQENRIVIALANICQEIQISAEADILPRQEEAVDYGTPQFRPGRSLLWSLDHLMDVQHVHLPTAELSPVYHLQYFSDRKDEISWAAGEVKRLLVEENIWPDRIAIALANPAYALEMQIALKRLNIPFYANDELQESESAFVRYMDNLLQILRFGFTEEYVMPILRSPYTPMTDEEADTFENFCLSRGIVREALWEDVRFSETWQVPDTIDEDEEEEQLEEKEEAEDTQAILLGSGQYYKGLRDENLGALLTLTQAFRGEHSVIQFVKLLMSYLQVVEMEEQISTRSQELIENSQELFAEHEVKSWNLLIELFQEFIAVDPEAVLTAEDFLHFIHEAILQGIKRRIPAMGNQVILASINQVAQEEQDYIFVLGAEQKVLPGKGFQGSLLNVADRQTMNEYIGSQLPNNEELRLYAGRSHLYGIGALAQFVYISYTGTDEQASEIMEELSSAYGIKMHSHDHILSLHDPVLAAPKQAWAYALENRTFFETSTSFSDLENYIRTQDPQHYAHSLRQGEYRELQREGALNLSPGLVEAYLPKDSNWSVSRLEKYASCPFAFYSRYMLGLKNRDVWIPEASDYGNLLHKYFELAQMDLELRLQESDDRQETLQAIRDQFTPEYIDEVFERARLEEPSVGVFWEDGEPFGLLHKAKRAAHVSSLMQLEELNKDKVQWVPAMEEWSFGPEDGRGYSIQYKDMEIAFNGRIDRVDLAENNDGRWGRMLDYKTGQKRVSYPNLYYGLDLQLPIYLSAFESLHPDYKAKDAAYVPLTFPTLNRSEAVLPEDEDVESEVKKTLKFSNIDLEVEDLAKVMKRSQKLTGQYVERMYGGDFSAHPVSTENSKSPCTYCEFRSLCRVDQRYIDLEVKDNIKELATEVSGSNITQFKQALIELLKEDA